MITGTADCAAQCHGPRGIMAALNVGVCIIEHGISHGGDGPRGECRSWWYLPPPITNSLQHCAVMTDRQGEACMSTSSDGLTAGPTTNRGRIRLVVFRVLAALAGSFFLVAVVLAVPAPWVLLQPEDPNAAENRWFLTVAGSVDAIAVVVFFALVQRPRRTLLFVEMSAAAVIAAVIILPFGLFFAAILAVAVVPLVAYPYWRDVRAFPSWWPGVPRLPVILAGLAGVALLVTAALALPRQIGGTDPAAQANWWSDYAEHATILAVAGVLAASRGPGWRILRYTCAAVWLYLGFVATLVLSHHTGSWGYIGGSAAIFVGLGFALAAWRGAEEREPRSMRSRVTS
jgi:hypothetical protein